MSPTRRALQVLGAAMFHVRVGNASVVYTGDYNMTPDRHLGAAWIDKVRPDVLITESTYATTIRDSKRARERDFLKKVHECVAQNGKVGPGTRPCLWVFFFSLRTQPPSLFFAS